MVKMSSRASQKRSLKSHQEPPDPLTLSLLLKIPTAAIANGKKINRPRKVNQIEIESKMSAKLKCVIVAVDGSEESMSALKWALDNLKLKSEGGSFVVFHVQSPPSIAAGLNPGAIPFGGPSDFEVPAFAAAIEAHQKRITQAIFQHALRICSEKNVQVETKVEIGDPKEKICEAVEELHADLLVMGSRAFGPIKRMFLGSVSSCCSNRAQCPVMIVKGSS